MDNCMHIDKAHSKGKDRRDGKRGEGSQELITCLTMKRRLPLPVLPASIYGE